MKILDMILNREKKCELITEDFFVSGVSYYTKNIDKLATIRPEWKNADIARKNIYKYNYVNYPVKLVPEPSNKHDKNAVQVLISGELVGYISSSDNLHVLDILKKKNVKYVSSFISGGPFKVVSSSGTVSTDVKNISINVRIAYS